MGMSDFALHQRVEDDPLTDPWTALNDRDYDVDMAVGPVITPHGLRGVYSTFYRERSPTYSEIRLVLAGGSPPDYDWHQSDVVLSHSGDEKPWVIDAHLTYDEQTDRLWMTWGGGTVYVSELDPQTGLLVGDPPDTEFDTHPEGMHTPVARRPVDGWQHVVRGCRALQTRRILVPPRELRQSPLQLLDPGWPGHEPDGTVLRQEWHRHARMG